MFVLLKNNETRKSHRRNESLKENSQEKQKKRKYKWKTFHQRTPY